MNKTIVINYHLFRKIRIALNEYIICSFYNNIFVFKFFVTLQPTGNEELPTYQLKDKKQSIPTWLPKQINKISDWIIQE